MRKNALKIDKSNLLPIGCVLRDLNLQGPTGSQHAMVGPSLQQLAFNPNASCYKFPGKNRATFVGLQRKLL